jgi:integral membrane sensor domain MASE1
MGKRFDRRTLAVTCAVLAAVYFLAGKLGLTLAFVNASATTVWPPAGIAVAALLLFGNRMWAGIRLGAFPAGWLPQPFEPLHRSSNEMFADVHCEGVQREAVEGPVEIDPTRM